MGERFSDRERRFTGHGAHEEAFGNRLLPRDGGVG